MSDFRTAAMPIPFIGAMIRAVALVTLSLELICLPPLRAAQGDGGLIADVSLRDGRTQRIVHARGAVKLNEDDGGSVSIPLANLQQLDLAQAKGNLSVVGGRQLTGTVEPFTITGDGDFGPTTIPSQSISLIKLSNNPHHDPGSARDRLKVTLVLTNGATMPFAGLNQSRIDGRLVAGAFSIDMAWSEVSKVEVDPDGVSLRLTLMDGQSIAARAAKPFSIACDTTYGTADYMSTSVRSISLGNARPTPAPRAGNGLWLSVISKDGTTIRENVNELKLGSFQFNLSKSTLAEFKYSAADGILLVRASGKEEKRFKLTGGNPDTLLNGYLSQEKDSPVRIPVDQIGAIGLLNAAAAPPAKAANNGITLDDKSELRVETTGLPSVSISRNAFDVFFPSMAFQQEAKVKEDLTALGVGNVRYLVDGTEILARGAVVAGKSLGFVVANTRIETALDSLSVNGEADLGAFRLAGRDLAAVSVPSSRELHESLYTAATGDVVVNVKGGTTFILKEPVFNASNSIHSGYYLQGSGRLYRLSYHLLPVKSKDGSVVWVAFNKIRKLDVGASYSQDKAVTGESLSGQQLAGSVDLESAKQSTESTYLSDEGILGKITPSVYLFIPMQTITTLETIPHTH